MNKTNILQDIVRMAITIDLDITMANYLELYVQFGCHSDSADGSEVEEHEETWSRQNDILVQYSDNGGILWRFLYEVKHTCLYLWYIKLI